jgi:Photosynthesis system II assembly factor YCF48/Putative zinc-finger
MAELPKIVKSRLAQQRSADFAAHPDANLLAAFAEQTLLERERMAVSAHLAQCADCRESLALAGMAQPVAEPAAAAPKRHWFLEWRWVGAAAAACFVIAVVLQYRVQPPATEKTNYAVASPMGAAPVPRPAQPAQQIAAAQRLKVEHLKKALQIPAPPSHAQEQTPPTVMTQLNVTTPERNPAAVTPVEAPALSGQADILAQSGLEPKAFRAETAETARAQKDIAAFQAKSGPSANVFVQGMVARAPLAAARTASRLSKATVLWSINASPGTAGNAHGVVERSLDAGKTWEVVPLSDDVSFRVVASAGPHVWAGGTSGALFHSADGGAHWERITVSDEGDKPNGTIVNIDARDANLIKITTSSGEKWISSDGGRQWKRE